MKVHDENDEELIQKYGIDQAFRIIFDRRLNEIYSYCLMRLSHINYYDIDSVVYDIFEKAWKNRNSYKGYYIDKQGNRKEARFKNWIYTIARHRCYDIIHKYHPVYISLDYIDVAKSPSTPLRVILKEFKDFLKRKLVANKKELLNSYYRIFYLKFVEGYTYREVAVRCHINQNTVRHIGILLKGYYREFSLL